MPDVLSPADRALIDAALAAGLVTVVPRGVSGLPSYVCDPETGKLVTGLTAVEVRAAERARGRRIAERRARVAKGVGPVDLLVAQVEAALIAGGKPKRVADAAGVPLTRVYEVARRLRAEGRLAPVQVSRSSLADQCMALHQNGLSMAQIAQRLGVSRGAVAGYLHRARARVAAGDDDAA